MRSPPFFSRALALGLVATGLIASDGAAAAPRLRSTRPVMLVSDIDDTIKRTNVLSKRGILLNGPRTTNPFEGMNELYAQLICDTVTAAERARCISRQALTRAQNRQVVYVTAAKGSLQMFGSLFLERSGFPVGLFIGREQIDSNSNSTEISSPSEDLSERYPHTLEYKIETIQKLIADYPEFDFILVGDNGEKDVAAYDAVAKWAAKRHPQAKIHSFIHQVYDWNEGVPPVANQTLYVTGGDLGIELYRRGLMSEHGLSKALDATLKAVKRDSSDVFPPFMNCRSFLDPDHFPKMPEGLSAPVEARVTHLFNALKRQCSR